MASRVIHYKRMHGVDCWHGSKFEMDMTALVYLRCQRFHEKWKREGMSGIKYFAVANNVEGAGKFDDLVVGVEYITDGVFRKKLIFVQCKHVEDINKNSEKKFKNLLCDSKVLEGYLKSYKDIAHGTHAKKELNNFNIFFTGETLDIEVIFYSNLNIVSNDFESNFFLANTPNCEGSDIVTEIFNSSKSEQFELKFKKKCCFVYTNANRFEELSIVKNQFCERFRVFVNQLEPEILINKEIELLTNISEDSEYLRDLLVQEIKYKFTSQKLCFALTESDDLLQNVRNYFHLKLEGEAILKQFRKKKSSMRLFSDESIEKYKMLIHSQCYNTIRTEYTKLEELKFMQFFCTKAEGATFLSINDIKDEEKLISSRKTSLYEHIKQVYIFSTNLLSFDKETLKHSEVVIQSINHSEQQMTLTKYIEQFSNYTEQYILNTKVCFQGESTNIKALCGEMWKIVFDEKSICDILENKLLEISTPLPILDFYVPRTFTKEILNLEFYKERTKTWKINSDCIILFSEENECIPGHDANYKVFLNMKEVRTFVQKLVEEDKISYHLCSHSNDQLQWIYSFGKKRGFTREYIIGEDALTIETHAKISILSDVAGMGKTTTLLSLARKYKLKNPSHWVLYIELNKWLHLLKEIHEFPVTKFAVHFIGKTLLNLKATEFLLFTKACESGKSAIFFDAFDEISPDAERSFPLLLLALEKTRIKNVVVSSRPNFASILEKKLLIKPIKFQVLNTEEKGLALEGYWKQMLKNDGKIIEDNLLKKTAKITVELLQLEEIFLSEILAIPLQIRMVAIVYYELVSKINSKEKVPLLSSINLAALYEQFIVLLAERFFVDKHNMKWINVKIEQKERFIQDKLKGSEEIACQTIIQEVLKNNIIDRTEEISALCDDVGIITNKSPVVFLHRTVTEYLAAKYIVREIFCKCNTDDTQIVANILVDIKYNTLRKFINSLLIGTTADIFGHFQTKEIEIIKKTSLETPIYVAASEGNVEILRLMASNNALLNMKNYSGMTALLKACKYCGTETVNLLLSHKDCSVNICDKYGETILHGASTRGNIENMQLILQRDSSLLNVQNRNGFTPLLTACSSGQTEAAKLLLSQENCSVNICDNNGNTVLHIASTEGNIEIMQIILQRDSSLLNKVNKNGLTPLQKVCHSHNSEPAKVLLSHKDCTVNIFDNSGNTLLHSPSTQGNVEVMQLILQRNSSTLNMKNDIGYTPLHEAYLNGEIEAVKLFLAHKKCSINICADDGDTVLHFASRAGDIEIMQLILQFDSSPLNMQNIDGFTPLHEACSYSQIIAVKLLLSHKDCSVNICDNNGDTILHCASGKDDIEIMQLILQHDSSLLNMQNKSGFTPLQAAYNLGKTKAVKLLLSHKDCTVNMCNNDGDTVLHFASTTGNIEIMQLILERDSSSLNIQNKIGFTPLHAASHHRETGAVKLLLSHKDCSVNICDNDGKSVLHFASLRRNIEIMQLILQRDSSPLNIQNKGFTPLHEALICGQTKAVKLLLSNKDCSVNICDNNGETILHLASKRGDTEVMRIILERDCSLINMQNKSGITPLHVASKYDQSEAVKLLYSYKDCFVNVCDNDDDTVLHFASRRGNIDVMTIILERDSSLINMQNRKGFTPLHEAFFHRKFRATKYLLSHKDCIVKMCDNDGDTVLHLASRKDNIEIMQLILQLDSSLLNMQNKSIFTPLQAAFDSGKIKAAKLLLSHKDCTVNMCDNDGDTVLHFASKRGNTATMQLILERDCSLLNMQNKSGVTPLLAACKYCKSESAKLLLSHKDCSVNLCNKDGDTVLHFASTTDNIEIMQLILERDSSLLNMQNASGVTPLLAACKYGKYKSVKLLLSQKNCSITNCDNGGDTVLHVAAMNGFVKIMQLIFHRNSSLLNIQNKSGFTPLHQACDLGKFKAVEYLIAQTDCMINMRDFSFPHCLTALDHALKRGFAEIIKLLLEHGAKSNELQCT